MKENAKIIIACVITLILGTIINVTATTLLQANQVSYKTSNGEITDVNSALDRLFDVADINGRLGNTDISSIGDGTVTGAISGLNSNLENLIWTQTLAATGSGNLSDDRRILNPDGSRMSIDNNKNHVYLVIMSAKPSTTEATYDSISVVNFSSTGANVDILSHTDSYPFPALTAEFQLITGFNPSSYLLSCIVSIIKIK